MREATEVSKKPKHLHYTFYKADSHLDRQLLLYVNILGWMLMISLKMTTCPLSIRAQGYPCLICTKWTDYAFEFWLIKAFTKVSHDILASKIRNILYSIV